MINCFEPIIDKQGKLLILGSMPGGESLRKQQYYGFTRNHFWRILYTIFNEELVDDYGKKITFLIKHQLALWDVLKGCEREGSLDVNIKNEEANDFINFFISYPHIKYVVFNGTKAESSFKKHIGFEKFPQLSFFQLPSTSPANTKPMEQKLKEWMIIRELLEKS